MLDDWQRRQPILVCTGTSRPHRVGLSTSQSHSERVVGRALRLSNGAASRQGAVKPTVRTGAPAPPAALAPVPAYERPYFLTGVHLALSTGAARPRPRGGYGAVPGGGRGPGGVGAMAESDWDTVTVLRKKGPSAAQAKSKQVSAGSGGARERGREGGGPGRGVVEATAPSGAARAALTAHLRSFPRRSWRPSGAGRTWRPLRSVGIPRGGLGLVWGGCFSGERRHEAAPPG